MRDDKVDRVDLTWNEVIIEDLLPVLVAVGAQKGRRKVRTRFSAASQNHYVQ